MRKSAVPAHVRAHATGRWAETICRVLGTRVARRWKFVSFRGRGKGEWRGVVDLIAIRKSTAQPSNAVLKRGDLFDIILIQTKGGSARAPTDQDCTRLRAVGRWYHAKAIVHFQWRRGDACGFRKLVRGRWIDIAAEELFR